MADRFTNLNGTAPIVSNLKNEREPVSHSLFDLSHKVYFPAAPYWIIPFSYVETLPDSDYEISVDLTSISTNPLVKRILTGMNVYVHAYATEMSSLCDGFNQFVTRGRSGSFSATLPTLARSHLNADGSRIYSSIFSPSSFLGFGVGIWNNRTRIDSNGIVGLCWLSDVTKNGVTDDGFYPFGLNALGETVSFDSASLPRVSALLNVFYQQICVYNYFPSNLLQDNKHLYPDNEQHFKLSADALNGSVWSLDYDYSVASNPPTYNEVHDFTYKNNSTRLFLDRLQVRMFNGDDFNTALPFPDLVRGDLPSIDFAVSDVTIPAGTLLNENVAVGSGSPVGTELWRMSLSKDIDTDSITVHVPDLPAGGTSFPAYIGSSEPELAQYGPLAGHLYTDRDIVVPQQVKSILTMSQLRALTVLTTFRERMARTDGSYNEMIKAQFNKSPEFRVGKPFYIGGFKQPIVFSEVVQTAQDSNNQTPLGTTASRAISAGNGYIGRFHSKDYGYIMLVLSVVPDTVYVNQIRRGVTRINQDDFYFPINNNLSPMAILNREVSVSGDPAIDNDVFGYQERDYDYKSISDRAVSLFACDHAVQDDFASMIAARRFGRSFDSTSDATQPTLSYSFAAGLPSSFDYSIFSNQYDPPFAFAAGVKVRAVQPMPYVTVPDNLID